MDEEKTHDEAQEVGDNRTIRGQRKGIQPSEEPTTVKDQPVTSERIFESLRYLNEDAFRHRAKK